MAHRFAGEIAQFLLDFRSVPMLRHFVSLKAVTHLTKMDGQRDPAPCPRYPRLGIGNQGPVVDETLIQERSCRENDAGRITAGVGHEPRLADRLAMELGQAVNSPREKFRGFMRLIPGGINESVLQAIVGAEIDNLDAPSQEFRDDIHGCLMGESGEDQVGLGGQNLGVGVFENELAVSLERRVDFIQALPGLLPGGDSGQLDLRMMAQESNQLETCVTGSTGNGYPQHMLPRF